MSADQTMGEELTRLEAQLRLTEVGAESDSLARIFSTVQAHVNMSQPVRRRRWSRRIALFAIVGVPAAGAAALAGIALLAVRPTAVVPRPRPVNSSAPAAEPLLVIAQRITGSPGIVPLGQAPDTVLLVRRDGTLVAKASFKPAERPVIDNAATILPPQVHAVAGAAFYVDGDGVVRRLDRQGAISVVATFATTEPQHMISFAVSPDGSKLMASVFTFGAKGPGLPGPSTIGPSYDNLEYADAGGSSRVLSHTPLSAGTGHFMVVGWDQVGPLAGTSAAIATQNVIPAGWGSPIRHLDDHGDQTGMVAGGCTVGMESTDGQFLCAGSQFGSQSGQVSTTIRAENGTVLWTLPAEAAPWYSAALSPDADIVALSPLGTQASRNRLYFKGGATAVIPDDFYSAGWLDENHLMGYSGDINSPSPRLAQILVGPGAAPAPGAAQIFPVPGSYIGVVAG